MRYSHRSFFTRSDKTDVNKLYDHLQLDKSASDGDIKRQYYKLAKEYHPDVNKTKEAKKKYLDITEAYQTLSDPKKRRIYDSTGMTSND